MDIGVFVPSVPYTGSVLVVGLFLWRVFAMLHADMGTRFEHMEASSTAGSSRWTAGSSRSTPGSTEPTSG